MVTLVLFIPWYNTVLVLVSAANALFDNAITGIANENNSANRFFIKIAPTSWPTRLVDGFGESSIPYNSESKVC